MHLNEFSETERVYGSSIIISEHYHIQDALVLPLVTCPPQWQPLSYLLPLSIVLPGFEHSINGHTGHILLCLDSFG